MAHPITLVKCLALLLIVNDCNNFRGVWGWAPFSIVSFASRRRSNPLQHQSPQHGGLCATFHPDLDDTNEQGYTCSSIYKNSGHTRQNRHTADRRRFLAQSTAAASLASVLSVSVSPASADTMDPAYSVYRPAKRPLVYRVDSSQPPTLLSLSSAREQQKLLTNLGKGGGTDKQEIVIDTVNLNNMLNKAVFGTIGAVSSLLEPPETSALTLAASFCCLGMPLKPSSVDVDLAMSLIEGLVKPRKIQEGTTLIGLAWCPVDAQSLLDAYRQGQLGESDLQSELFNAGVSLETSTLYLPLLQQARQLSLPTVALGLPVSTLSNVRRGGLQALDPAEREIYVADTNGFIQQTQDPGYQLYTDRSLLKQVDAAAAAAKTFTGTGGATAIATDSSSSGDSGGVSVANAYAQVILSHEAAATIAVRASLAARNGDGNGGNNNGAEAPFMVVVGPMQDVRYLQGLNGRIPRVARALNLQPVSDRAVTTILLNPTAADTLSSSRRLRLEIGTAPETLDFQAKIADYLWFSKSPPVNLLPRLMNG